MILHAGLIALRLGGFWRGALILGPSGAGKSDLALRALDAGFRLVSDDRTLVWASGGAVYGRAPTPLAGLIEARGQGLTPETPVGLAEIALAVHCVEDPADIERMPETEAETLAGVAISRIRLNTREPSATAKLRRALQHLGVAA